MRHKLGITAMVFATLVAAGAVLEEKNAFAQAFGTALPRAPIEPLGVVGVPDMNEVGLLDRTGTNANLWPGSPVTKPGQKSTLRVLGKALFWDMQVGGDGIQSCASCHFHAGADNRIVNQISPGRDKKADIAALNAQMGTVHFAGIANDLANSGFDVDEQGLVIAGATADAIDGTPGLLPSDNPDTDINDVMSSQGIRAGTHIGLSGNRVDLHTLAESDPGFDNAFGEAPAAALPDTVRRVPGRNSPSALNAVYNLRNFWDGRANMYFNGVNPFGINDPDAKVKVYSATTGLGEERLDIPFSSLASQAVGPIGSVVEMIFDGRSHQELGKKLTAPGVVPLDGQAIAENDSLLGTYRAGSGRGMTKTYAELIKASFDQRFWGDGSGNDVCLDADGNAVGVASAETPCTSDYTLLQWNFPLFFGLAVQAYEATLTTPETIVDLIAGGKATGTITNAAGTGRNRKVVNVNVNGLALEGCIAAVALNTSAAQQAIATGLCTTHYAKFIHPKATSGTESALAPFPVTNGAKIGGQCTGSLTSTTAVNTSADCVNARNTLLNVERGLGRFFAGATGCAICHFNPEFTGATVSTQTRFGAVLPVLPNGQLRRELEARAVMERMPTFNGLPAVYDVGFYNIGVRPTAEDISVGDKIGGVPLSFSMLQDIVNGGTNDNSGTGTDKPINLGKTLAAGALLSTALVPTDVNDLTPRPFPFEVGCAPGLVGGGNANNNPVNQCVPTVIANERLQINGSFKTPGLRNVKFTGPYMHNGSKMNIRQVVEFYETAGHFTNINFNNLDAGMRIFDLGPTDTAALVELMETGLTDWRVAHKEAPFDHPELCLPNGHDPATRETILVGLPAVGKTGTLNPIATFEEMLIGYENTDDENNILRSRSNSMRDPCTVPGLVAMGSIGPANSLIDVPPLLP